MLITDITEALARPSAGAPGEERMRKFTEATDEAIVPFTATASSPTAAGLTRLTGYACRSLGLSIFNFISPGGMPWPSTTRRLAGKTHLK